MYKCHILLFHSSLVRYLGCFHFLVVNTTPIDVGTEMISVPLRCFPFQLAVQQDSHFSASLLTLVFCLFCFFILCIWKRSHLLVYSPNTQHLGLLRWSHKPSINSGFPHWLQGSNHVDGILLPPGPCINREFEWEAHLRLQFHGEFLASQVEC